MVLRQELIYSLTVPFEGAFKAPAHGFIDPKGLLSSSPMRVRTLGLGDIKLILGFYGSELRVEG